MPIVKGVRCPGRTRSGAAHEHADRRVSRLLQTRSIGGSAPLKCRALSSCQIAVSCCEFGERFARRAMRGVIPILRHRGNEQRQHNFMMADQRIAFSALLGRPPHDVGEWAIVGEEIHVDGRDVRKLMTQVASKRHGFQEHFRQNHRGTEIEITPPSIPATTAASRRKSNSEVAPIAAPSAAGCM